MIVVGLTGYARSGKDTVANHLVAEHGFVPYSFASPLKEIVRELDPLCDSWGEPYRLSAVFRDCDDNEDQVKRYAPEYRRVLEVLGTKCLRSRDPDIWVNMLSKKLLAERPERAVITDVRFPNEAGLLRMFNHSPLPDAAELWRVHRPGFIPLAPTEPESHIHDLPVDRILTNDRTIEDLHKLTDLSVGGTKNRVAV